MPAIVRNAKIPGDLWRQTVTDLPGDLFNMNKHHRKGSGFSWLSGA
jgi:hypothetical protein